MTHNRAEQTLQRLAAARAWLAAHGLVGLFVPRADEAQGEYVAARDERLDWLLGFDGSAGTALVLAQHAALIVDGRYTTQAERQLTGTDVQPLHYMDAPWEAWAAGKITTGAKIAFDARLHTPSWVARTQEKLKALNVELVPLPTDVFEEIWQSRPAAPQSDIWPYPESFSGEASASKRQKLAEILKQQNAAAVIMTDPMAVAWVLNIRAADVPHLPVAQGKLLLQADGQAVWYVGAARATAELKQHLGEDVQLADAPQLLTDIADFKTAKILLDEDTASFWLQQAVQQAGAVPVLAPCIAELPKAQKNATELAGITAAHVRDGAALVKFMHWLHHTVLPHGNEKITEQDAMDKLLALRQQAPEWRDKSFETICGHGPNGAVIHYRTTPTTNRALTAGTLLLVDSGAQYIDGTTDVTRVFALGAPTPAMRQHYTLVLKGHVQLARARFPAGTTGAQLDVLARQFLWQTGLNYDHGTGHGVGHYLSVHEGPQSISSRSKVALLPGMVVSNEPGYYLVGQYGIRIENLIYVRAADVKADRTFYEFATLTLAPYERGLIDKTMLSADELAWVNAYHAEVLAKIGSLVDADVRAWLAAACAPL